MRRLGPSDLLVEARVWFDFFVRNIPGRVGMLVRRLVWGRRFGCVGKGLYLEEGVIVRGCKSTFLGDGTLLSRGSSLYSEGGVCRIADRFALGIGSMVDANDGGEIIIGDDVIIATGCVLRASNHEFRDPASVILKQGHRGGRIIIGNDVWIAANVVILPNVVIGDHSIVAAGAVVNRDVEPWSIVGGVPARVIGTRPHTPPDDRPSFEDASPTL